MPDIVSWLCGHGLERYAQAFAANDTDFNVLPDLSEGNFERLGVTLGHRKKLQRALEASRQADGSVGLVPPAADQSSRATAWQTVSASAERRQLTVMFVDLVGSTDLALKLEPEELRELCGANQDALGAEAARHGGHVAKVIGDGLLVYFGYPDAHEDDAVRRRSGYSSRRPHSSGPATSLKARCRSATCSRQARACSGWFSRN